MCPPIFKTMRQMATRGLGMNKKGQAVLSEYVMIFFVVIAAIVAMTVFVQRSLQGRIHDARNYMIDSVTNTGACDANCLLATGATTNQIPYQYEPYYAQVLSDTEHNEALNSGMTNGQAAAIGAVYTKGFSDTSKTIATSVQLPSECADGVNPKPAYCGN